MNNLVYLYELDSVCNSSKEMEFAMKSLYKTLVVDGDILVLTLNQFADSMVLMSIVNDSKMCKVLKGLIEQQRIVLSSFRMNDGTLILTPAQYILKKIDSYLNENQKFVFSAVECLNISNENLKKSLMRTIKFVLEKHLHNDLKSCLGEDVLRTISEIDPEYVDLLSTYVSFLNYTSNEKIKCLEPKVTRMDLWKCIDSVAKKNLAESTKKNIDILKQCSESKSERSLLLELIHTHIDQYERDDVERVINVCYNLSVESSISGIESILESPDKKTYFLEKIKKLKENYKISEHKYGCKTSNPPIYVFDKREIYSWQSALRIVKNLNGDKDLRFSFIERLYKKIVETTFYYKIPWKIKVLIYLIVLVIFVCIEITLIGLMLFKLEDFNFNVIDKTNLKNLLPDLAINIFVVFLCEFVSYALDVENIFKLVKRKDIYEDIKTCCNVLSKTGLYQKNFFQK